MIMASSTIHIAAPHLPILGNCSQCARQLHELDTPLDGRSPLPGRVFPGRWNQVASTVQVSSYCQAKVARRTLSSRFGMTAAGKASQQALRSDKENVAACNSSLRSPPANLPPSSTRRASSSTKETPSTSFPGSIEEVTTSWLTDVLSESGSIGPDSVVQSFEFKQIGKGVGLLSALYSISVSYVGAPEQHAPLELVAKFAPPLEEARSFGLR